MKRKSKLQGEPIWFVTTNTYKFEEAREILKPFGLKLVQKNLKYEEDHDATIDEIALHAAGNLAARFKRPIIVEDTGLFFKSYKNFPGPLPKFVFNAIGYEGIFKLLKGKNRRAYFKTVVGFARLGKPPRIFSGKLNGMITEKVYNGHIDVMPYDRIFVPEGERKTISGLMDRKNEFSQRAEAFRKLGHYLTS